MRIVIAPDSFKGTVGASAAAAALAAGWLAVRPGDEVVLRPMADGGEGTLAALGQVGGERLVAEVPGPAGRPVRAEWLLLPDGTGVVELAASSGLLLLDRPRPLTASTRGFGATIAAALDAGARRLRLAIGGSASTDGGTGALAALGARFLDPRGAELPDGGGALERLARADLGGLRPPPPGGAVVLTDVSAPLLGSRGAAAVYGPQKGADAADVARLERGLARLAAVLGADPAATGAGAAGGTAYGLGVWGATAVGGGVEVATAIGLPAALAAADLVITGEGRFDGQSATGKVPVAVADLARVAGVPALLVAGAIDAPVNGFAEAIALVDLVGREQSLREPSAALRRAGGVLARRSG